MTRDFLLALAVSALVTACMSEEADRAHVTVSLPLPYSDLPPSGPIEKGRPVNLTPLQQEAVVVGVTNWMKEPRSVVFGAMEAARNSNGRIVVCGEVDGRNSVGRYGGLSPYIGALMESPKRTDFVVVGIASTVRERKEIASLCEESGVHVPADTKVAAFRLGKGDD